MAAAVWKFRRGQGRKNEVKGLPLENSTVLTHLFTAYERCCYFCLFIVPFFSPIFLLLRKRRIRPTLSWVLLNFNFSSLNKCIENLKSIIIIPMFCQKIILDCSRRRYCIQTIVRTAPTKYSAIRTNHPQCCAC